MTEAKIINYEWVPDLLNFRTHEKVYHLDGKVAASLLVQAINGELKQVVRCADCKHYQLYCGWTGKGWYCGENGCRREADDFCSRGVRKDDEIR